jgi:hypothetical protein
VIKVVIRIEDNDFTLKPASPELFVATFWSQELRDRASKVSDSQEWPSISSGRVEVSDVEGPPREVLTGVRSMDEATALPPHAHQITVIPVFDLATVTEDHPPPEPYAVDDSLQLAPVLADDDTPPGFTPPRSSTPVRGPTATMGATDVPNRHDPAHKMETFVVNVTRATPAHLLDMSPRCRQVDEPPHLPSSEASRLSAKPSPSLGPPLSRQAGYVRDGASGATAR